MIESLIKSGAMDSLPGIAPATGPMIDSAMERGQKLHREKTSGQSVFFSSFPTAPAASASSASEHPFRTSKNGPRHERLAGEFATLGFYISGHPLAKFAGRLKELNAVEIWLARRPPQRSEVIVAGHRTVAPHALAKRRPLGHRHAAGQTGVVEALVVSRSLSTPGANPERRLATASERRVNVEEAGTRLAVAEAKPIEQMAQRVPALLCVRVDLEAADPDMLERTRAINGQPTGPLSRRI